MDFFYTMAQNSKMRLFRPVTLQDRDTIREYVNKAGCRDCNLSFANIFCWSETFSTQIAFIEGFFIIKFTYEDGTTSYFRPVGKGDRKAVLQALEQDAGEEGVALRIDALDPEWTADIEAVFQDRYALAPNRDYSDYVYLSSDLASLPGRKYQHRRNHVNNFRSRYNYSVERLCKSNFSDCMKVDATWLSQKQDDTPTEKAEQRSIELARENMDALGIEGCILYADSTPVAFTYGNPINADTFDTQIEKADRNYEGAAAMINMLFAEQLQSRYMYINREEDLGIAGLRFSKTQYHPAFLLEHMYLKTLTCRERQIRALWESVFGDTRELVDSFLMWHSDPQWCFVHEENGEVISMLHVIPLKSELGDVAYFYAVATRSDHRRQGLMHRLMLQALDKVRGSGRFAYAAMVPGSNEGRLAHLKVGFSSELYPVRFSWADYAESEDGSAQAMMMAIKATRMPDRDRTLELEE